MALYSHLPVYKASYDLLLEIFNFTKNLPREYRYTTGEEIKKKNMEMVINIYRANRSYSKEDIILAAIENLEIIRLHLRVLKDLKQISLKKFIQINEKVENVSKQLTAWKRSNSK